MGDLDVYATIVAMIYGWYNGMGTIAEYVNVVPHYKHWHYVNATGVGTYTTQKV